MQELFCKKVIDEIMPAIRLVIANELYNKGYTQTQIANILGVTQPAIVNYRYKLRGKLIKRIKLNKKLRSEINNIISDIVNKNGRLVNYTCKICEITRNEHLIRKEELNEFICAKTL